MILKYLKAKKQRGKSRMDDDVMKEQTVEESPANDRFSPFRRQLPGWVDGAIEQLIELNFCIFR